MIVLLVRRGRVHPRVGGGAGLDGYGRDGVEGPSPRRRGSLSHPLGKQATNGSIPA